MRSRNSAGPAANQRGFSLMEVMVASTILSIMILGMSSFWFSAAQRASDVVLRQKAIFVLNAEVERLTALYTWTAFGASNPNGTQVSTGYTGASGIPTSRLVYPANVGTLMPANTDNFITSTVATFQTGSEFLVWLEANSPSTANRNYVWIDRGKNIVGRLSWVTTDIVVSSCIAGTDCSCQQFNNNATAGGRCRALDVYLEYPYRYNPSGPAIAPAKLETVSLKTIVGRG